MYLGRGVWLVSCGEAYGGEAGSMSYLMGTSRFKAWTCETRSFLWSMTCVAPIRLQESIVSCRDAVAITAGRLSTLRDS
jgi:hypothetical protein